MHQQLTLQEKRACIDNHLQNAANEIEHALELSGFDGTVGILIGKEGARNGAAIFFYKNYSQKQFNKQKRRKKRAGQKPLFRSLLTK